MSKSKYFIGHPVLSQILNLIPKDLVNQISEKHKSDHYIKKFKAYDHLVSMLYCSLSKCNSLRELTTGIQASANRLQHLGLNYSQLPPLLVRDCISYPHSRTKQKLDTSFRWYDPSTSSGQVSWLGSE